MLTAVDPSKLSDLPGWAAELLRAQPVGRLAMLDDADHPRVLPITFAVAGGRIWSAVDSKPKRVPAEELARVRFLRRRPEAAFTVDSYSDDWDELAWVQVLGPVQVVPVTEGAEALAALTAKYPAYQRTPPGGPLLSLRPARCLCWRAAEHGLQGRA